MSENQGNNTRFRLRRFIDVGYSVLIMFVCLILSIIFGSGVLQETVMEILQSSMLGLSTFTLGTHFFIKEDGEISEEEKAILYSKVGLVFWVILLLQIGIGSIRYAENKAYAQEIYQNSFESALEYEEEIPDHESKAFEYEKLSHIYEEAALNAETPQLAEYCWGMAEHNWEMAENKWGTVVHNWEMAESNLDRASEYQIGSEDNLEEKLEIVRQKILEAKEQKKNIRELKIKARSHKNETV